MTITIRRNDDARCIFIESSPGPQFFDAVQAVIDNPSDVTINLLDLVTGVDLFTDVHYTEFVDEAANPWGATPTDTVNALNAAFGAGGAASGVAPVITSSLAVGITEGETLNYELIATNGVGYEWSSLPTGVVTTVGNVRKLVGGSLLTAVGSPYNIGMKAINYNGEDSETLVLTVSGSPYNNTKAIQFNNNEYMDAAATTSNPLYRASNGSGSGDAWTIVGWLKAGTANNAEQTLLSFGGSDKNNEGHVHLYWDASGGDERIVLEYGESGARLILKTPTSSVTDGTYIHVMVTYDGGTTGDTGAQINDYYGRFDIFLDGVSQTLTKSNDNDGFKDGMVDDLFRLGEASFGGKHLKGNTLLDEVAIWNTDETANVAAIYNSGTTHDLALLTSPPVHYWRMGDGDTFPDIVDNVGSLDFEMFNMNAGDIVTDTP